MFVRLIFSRSKTSNGIQASEQGQLKPNPAPKSADDPAAFIAVQGEFSYMGADGQIYTVRYIADENGYGAIKWISIKSLQIECDLKIII